MEKRFDINTTDGQTVLRGVGRDNAYLSGYGKVVRGGSAVDDLLVDEFTYREFALSGQRPTTYVIVRVQ